MKRIYGFLYFLLLASVILYLPASYAQETLRERIRERWLERKSKRQDSAEVNDRQFSLIHQGITRKYKVHLPPSYNGDLSTPVVIYLHGGGGSVRAAYLDKMDKASDKHGFILVIPAGTGRIPDRLLTWNGGSWGNESCCGYAVEHNIDDVGFISKVIDEIRVNFNVDEKRIYATGISNGGLMSYRLACELSDKIAAVAAVAPPAIPDNCSSSRPVPVMHIHGTADPCAPFDGGLGAGCLSGIRRQMLSARQMIDSWIAMNNCAERFTIAYQKGNTACISYQQCDGGAEVEFCTVTGGGHTWPSGSQYLPANKIGPVSYDISFEQLWEFFKRHPLEDAAIEESNTSDD